MPRLCLYTRPNHAVNQEIKTCFLKPLFCLRKVRFYSVSYCQTLWWLGFASDRSLPGLFLFSKKEALAPPTMCPKCGLRVLSAPSVNEGCGSDQQLHPP